MSAQIVCMKCGAPKGTPGPCADVGVYSGDWHMWSEAEPPQPLSQAVGEFAAALKTTALYRLPDRSVAALTRLLNRTRRRSSGDTQ